MAAARRPGMLALFLMALAVASTGAGAERKPDKSVAATSIEPESTVIVSEESMAYAACGEEDAVITGIQDPAYGVLEQGCNATDSYSIVAASCLGEHDCLVRASSDIFDDPCPGEPDKLLQFGIICNGDTSTQQPPPVASSPPPPPPPLQLRSPPPPPTSLPPSPPPPRPRPPPPTLVPVSVPSPPPPAAVIPGNSQTSLLWGQGGELYRPGGRLNDWSQAGYGAGQRPIPRYTSIINVRDAPYNARGDGTTDDSDAIQRAIDAAGARATSASGVAVFIPDGTYAIRKRLSITKSFVVLRGAGKDRTRLFFPVPLSTVYGNTETWAFSGGWLSVVGRRMQNKNVQDKITDVVGNANRGDYQLRVSTSAGIAVGQWVRVWQPSSDSTARRRLLAAAAEAVRPGRKLQQQAGASDAVPAMPVGKVSVLEADVSKAMAAAAMSPVPQWFEDPQMQAALEAAVKADWEIGMAVELNPDRVPSQSLEPNATNPLGLDPMILASTYYAALASESQYNTNTTGDPDRAPATAAMGSLESYLYGNNVVDSGTPSGMFYGKDRVRFVSRVAAVGPGWVRFERPLPYDIRLKWRPVLHRFTPSVVESGFEDMHLLMAHTPYADHINGVKGMNGIVMLDAAHLWVSNVRVTDADNGVSVSGVDFVTVVGVDTQLSRNRGTGPMATRNVHGHHALWTSSCSNVLVTKFDIPYRWFHDLSVDSFAESTVYSNGRGVDMNIDCHRAATHNNLFTNLDTGVGTRTFHSGGADNRGAQSGANTTWWNVYRSTRASVGLPECQFGPLLNFFGWWSAPKGAGRRLLAESPAANQTKLEAALAAIRTAAGGAEAGQQQEGGQQAEQEAVQAQSTAWCTREGWVVEQASAGRAIFPPDLHAAQVAARASGRLR